MSDATSHSSASIARASALMASGTFVSRILGMVRVLLLAGVLGLLESPAGNAWQTANTLPNTIYILLAGGVLNAILVPALTRAMAMSPERGRDFTDRLITLALLGLVAITVVVTAGATLLTKLYALSWSGEQLALAVAFAYLCLPQIFFYGVYTLLGQILNAQEKFGWYMWAPVANNVVAILGIVVFGALYPQARTIGPGEWSGDMIWLLAGTATLGVLVQAGVLVWPVWRSGFRYRPRWGFRGVGLGAASRMALWMLAVIGVSQTGMWLSTNVLNRAVELDPGAPGKILYENAFLIYILPHSLIATSLITAMFTQMSRSAQAQDLAGLGVQYRHGLRLLGVAMVPISVGLVLLAPAITSLLFYANTEQETLATAWVTMTMLIGLAPYAVYILSGRVFHAFQDGLTPFKLQVTITVISVGGILVAALLPPVHTAIGVALAQALGQMTAALLGLLWVTRRLGGVSLRDVLASYRRVLLATVAAALPTLGLVILCRQLLDGRPAALTMVFVGGPLFFLIYGAVAHRVGVTELAEVAAPVLRRLGRGRGTPAPGVAPTGGAGAPDPLPDPAPLPQDPAARPTDAPTARTTEATEADGEDPGAGQEGPDEQIRRAETVSRTWTNDSPALGLGAGVAAGEEDEVWGMAIDPGTILGGRYALEELLAERGDLLEYWSAQDQTLDRVVAVTVLPATGDRADLAHAVLDGARRTAGVDDPRLVRVLDVGEEDGRCWIVEEGLLDASSLASLTTDGPLPPEEARRIVGEAAVGMESARRRGLHHLYLNPHSVLRTGDGSVKVSGVGVTAALEQTDDIGAHEASVIDTTDLVSVLYAGLTGRWPGDEMGGLIPARRLADGSLPAPSEVTQDIPGDLDALCRTMLGVDYDPARGPQTPGELARQLSPWSSDIVQAAAPAAGSWSAPSDATDADDSTHASAVGAAAAGHRPSPDVAYYRSGSGDVGTAAYPPDDLDLGEDYDDAPDRGLPPGVRERESSSRGSWLVLLLIAVLIAAATFVAYGVIRSIGSPSDEDATRPLPTASPSPTEEEAEATDDVAEETSDVEETTEAPEPGEPIELAGASDFDTNGNEEKPELTARAIDGDPDTNWNTFTYLAPNWGNLKEGVALVIDTGEAQPISEVEIVFPRGDYGATVYVGDSSDDTDGTEIGSDDAASGTWTITPDEPAEGRYIVIFFDRAWAGPNGEIVEVSEVTARS